MTGFENPRKDDPLPVRVYARLARTLLPRRFHEECAEDLVATFSDALRDGKTRRDPTGRVALCCAEYMGLVLAAIREHSRVIRRRDSDRDPETTRGNRFDMSWLPREFQYCTRALAKTPGVVFSAVLALALGIGATTTMFSVSHGLLRDLPFDEAERLVYLGIEPIVDRGYNDYRLSVHEIVEWREQQSTLEELAGFVVSSLNLSSSDDDPERVSGARITANTFDALRVRPVLGRSFRIEEERPGAEPVAIIGYSLWKNRYSLEPDVLGRTVRVNGVQRTIVGVMPEGFFFPEMQDIWIPLELDPTAVERGEGRIVQTLGRMADEVSLEEVRAEYFALGRRMELAFPDVYEGFRWQVIPFKEHFVELDAVFGMNLMLGVVSFVLLIACANVANLLLARAASRSREVAVRTALGASRARVIGQMLTESLIISSVGGSLGIALAYVGVQAFTAPIAPLLPFFWMDIRVDGTVLMFTIVLVLASSVLAGTAPALKATNVNVNAVLKDEALGVAGLRLGRFSRMLVVGQVALSCGLLTVSGLMVKGALLDIQAELSFATTDVLTARVSLLASDYPDESDRNRFYRELVSRLEGSPGVAAAAVVSNLPGVNRSVRALEIDGIVYDDNSRRPLTRRAVVSPEFFDALDVRLIEGRGFTTADDADSPPVVIVNQQFAERFFSGESPLGGRIRTVSTRSQDDWRTIVGVAPNLAMNRRIATGADGIYVPLSQSLQSSMAMVVRTDGNPMSLVPGLREVVASIDPHLPIYDVNSLAEIISSQTVPERTFAALFVCCGSAALVLAVVGLYGVMAFAVRRRTKEIGIRMALGAKGKRILWLSFRGGFAQLLLGLFVGMCLAALIAPAMADMLFQASPWDWQIYLGIALTLCVSGVVASVVPAMRATRVDPLETLRCE